MAISFATQNVSIDNDAAVVDGANEALAKMRDGRIRQIEPGGKFIKSKLAWKLATLRQPLLYRVVALSESFAVNWNSQNLVGSYLPARALIETTALLLELDHDLERHILAQDLSAIDSLLMNSLFATRDAEWLDEHPEAKATNILTLIDRLDKRELNGIRGHYDLMSEVCHPNSLGHRLAFGEFDGETGSTAYLDGGWQSSYLRSLFASMVLILILGDTFESLETRIDEIVLLQAT